MLAMPEPTLTKGGRRGLTPAARRSAARVIRADPTTDEGRGRKPRSSSVRGQPDELTCGAVGGCAARHLTFAFSLHKDEPCPNRLQPQ